MPPCPKPSIGSKPNPAQLSARNRFVAGLVQELQDQDIYGCEICYREHEDGKRSRPDPKCWPIDPAHRHDRDDYKLQPEKLWTKNQVILAGRAHHTRMDADKAYREEVFLRMRGSDALQK